MEKELVKFQTEKSGNSDSQKGLEHALNEYRNLDAHSSEEAKSDLFSRFDKEILSDANQRYDNLNDTQKKQYSKLAEIWHANIGNNNDLHISEKDGKLFLRCQNKTTGLNMAIMDDSVSLVMAQDKHLSQEQTNVLRQFMDNSQLNVTQFPQNLKVHNEDGTDITIQEAWQKANPQNQKEAHTDEEELNNSLTVSGTENNSPQLPDNIENMSLEELENLNIWLHSSSVNSKPMNLDIHAMRDKVKARMSIMNFSSKLLTTRKTWDGGIIICAYNSEDDMLNDGKNQKGKIERKKAFAVKVKIKKGIPSASWYLPEGKTLETKNAVVMLEALKVTGAEYFSLPSADIIGGAAHNAFWEACGKTLMVPLCKTAEQPNGIDLGAADITAMLNVIKKDSNKDSEALADFKRKLLGELEAQEAFKAAKAAKEGKPYKTNSELATQMAFLRGGSSLEKFNLNYVDTLNEGIRKQATNTATGKQGWDFVETQAAFRAAVNVTEFFEKKGISYNSEIHQPLLDQMFALRMEQHKKEIALQMQDMAQNGNLRIDKICNNISKATIAMVEIASSKMEQSLGVKLALNPKGANISNNADISKYVDKNGNYIGKPTRIRYNQQTDTVGGINPNLIARQIQNRQAGY